MLRQGWRDVIFVHWRFDRAVVQDLLPTGLTVDDFDDAAWVTLIAFGVRGTRPALGPAVPFVSDFTETNVRTYVTGPDGRDGLWFFTLEADSVPTVLGARVIGVPYRWADMTARRSGTQLVYGSRRRSDTSGPMHLTSVETAGSDDVSDRRSHWLTGRWRAWTRVGQHFVTVPVEHQPWPLRSGRLASHEDSLLSDAGLPSAGAPPVVHTSVGVDAALGWPRPVHRGRGPDR
jgi:uncharacterized protein YqjF (DUF2071 family)